MMRTHRPTGADTLLNSLRLAIAHVTQMTQGTTVYGQHRIMADEFHAFRINFWWWQTSKLEQLWEAYTQAGPPEEQLRTLTNLQGEAHRLSSR